MNCCRKYLEYDPDYTRQLTPDNTEEDEDTEDDEHDYSEGRSSEEDEDMDEEEERDEENTDPNFSLDIDDEDDLCSEERRQLGLYPYDTYQSTEESSPEPDKQVQNRDTNAHNTEEMDTKTPNTSQEESLKEIERVVTPGVSNEVGKLSLEEDQLVKQEMDVENEVQIVGEVEYQSDDEKPKVRKKRKPTQRNK